MVFACLVGLKAHSTPLIGFSRTCVGYALITLVSNDNDNHTRNHSTQAWQVQRQLLVEGRHIGRRLLDNCVYPISTMAQKRQWLGQWLGGRRLQLCAPINPYIQVLTVRVSISEAELPIESRSPSAMELRRTVYALDSRSTEYGLCHPIMGPLSAEVSSPRRDQSTLSRLDNVARSISTTPSRHTAHLIVLVSEICGKGHSPQTILKGEYRTLMPTTPRYGFRTASATSLGFDGLCHRVEVPAVAEAARLDYWAALTQPWCRSMKRWETVIQLPRNSPAKAKGPAEIILQPGKGPKFMLLVLWARGSHVLWAVRRLQDDPPSLLLKRGTARQRLSVMEPQGLGYSLTRSIADHENCRCGLPGGKKQASKQINKCFCLFFPQSFCLEHGNGDLLVYNLTTLVPAHRSDLSGLARALLAALTPRGSHVDFQNVTLSSINEFRYW
ncbi:uncharacterized protein CLUP02_08445 [Colletotrichum lupini]|uniref:Uncharacterized protein n=1 Tax=Colletotrichum lupini TaxID=145971 RepID=A0A9Q8WHM3_9PEZI|nr:uncharacterized protein CLUP02_08445 [Colletotrichum lupini]UQC82955.1 hypothetical protein CLUP02_08445 [Colletotrichum lupini]